MKKLVFIGVIITAINTHQTAYALCQQYLTCNNCELAGEPLSKMNERCSSVQTEYFAVSDIDISNPSYMVYTCMTCKSGYTQRPRQLTLSNTCTMEYFTCEENCTGCTGCTSDATWSAAGTAGYEKKVTATCNCNTCNRTTQYRCAAGYYGRPTNGTSGCSPCDKIGGHGTSNAGSTAKTSCYVPANSNITDTIGTYHFTSNCFYTN